MNAQIHEKVVPTDDNELTVPCIFLLTSEIFIHCIEI